MSRRNNFYARPVVVHNHNRYGFFNFLLDLFMIGITGGLWLVWIIIRTLRN